MPFRKTEEEKQAEAAQQAAEAAAQAARQQAAAEEKRRAEHAASPVGRAEAAKERGDAFIQIEIAGVEVDGASSFGSSNSTMKRIEGTTKVLGEIEAVGWRLEHAGWVFVETGATTSDRIMSTGQGTATKGQIVGIYLFRAARDEL
jgi:hypothetical protein